MNIKSAEALRAEIKEEKERIAKKKEEQVKKKLTEIAAKIEKNKMNRQVTIQSISEETTEALVNLGYMVQHHNATHMGDVDTTTISW